MKILTPGTKRVILTMASVPSWAGAQVKCQSCGCEIILDEGDNDSITITNHHCDIPGHRDLPFCFQDVAVKCPTCGNRMNPDLSPATK